MRIAITADLHLTSRKQHPERFKAFENILDRLCTDGVSTLIVAGDCFDQTAGNFSEFETICLNPKFRDIDILVLRGNHDALLAPELFGAAHLRIVDTPSVETFDGKTPPFLLLPYESNAAMGARIADFSDRLPENNWILIGHGNWAGGLHEPNPLEPGVYMPLTRPDIERFRPPQVFLGHIHKPLQTGRICYVGSPCGIDITESGYRSFILYDTENQQTRRLIVAPSVLYFNETFVIYPVDDEDAFVRSQILERIDFWALKKGDSSRVKVQVRVLGYTRDKAKLMRIFKECFAPFSFHNDAAPDLSRVSVADDVNRAEIAVRLSQWVAAQSWDSNGLNPGKEEVLLYALKTIYGE